MDLELPTLQAIKQFVAMGHGVALVPEISVETELARGELVGIPVRELQLKRKLRLIYRKDANLSHAARAFLKVAEAVALDRKGRYRFQRENAEPGSAHSGEDEPRAWCRELETFRRFHAPQEIATKKGARRTLLLPFKSNSRSAVRAHPLFPERCHGRIHRRMNLQHRIQIRQLQQCADQRIRPRTLQAYVFPCAQVCSRASSPMPALSIELTPLRSSTNFLACCRTSPTTRDRAAASSRYTMRPWQCTMMTSPRLRVSRLSFNFNSLVLQRQPAIPGCSPICQFMSIGCMLVDRRRCVGFGTMKIW